MHAVRSTEVYSPREIARAAGVSEEQVLAALRRREGFVPHVDAVLLGRALAQSAARPENRVDQGVAGDAAERVPLFSAFAAGAARASSIPLLVSSTLHVGLIAALVFVTTLGPSPT